MATWTYSLHGFPWIYSLQAYLTLLQRTNNFPIPYRKEITESKATISLATLLYLYFTSHFCTQHSKQQSEVNLQKPQLTSSTVVTPPLKISSTMAMMKSCMFGGIISLLHISCYFYLKIAGCFFHLVHLAGCSCSNCFFWVFFLSSFLKNI